MIFGGWKREAVARWNDCRKGAAALVFSFGLNVGEEVGMGARKARREECKEEAEVEGIDTALDEAAGGGYAGVCGSSSMVVRRREGVAGGEEEEEEEGKIEGEGERRGGGDWGGG